MVELLAPAGEYNSLLGAFSAGADAVYLAGNMYGARASAVNFTSEEIISALKYAHLLNKKIYLTVNTLTKEEELKKLYDFLRPLYLSGLDAVLVQDVGVFDYIKECYPKLDIHMSTQAVVTSAEGAKFYRDRGASRVVLARELTLPEIESITKEGIETECFIHGAMCYGYSGMCLFSSFLGGNSGNRGRCKGPCRQPYKLNSNEEYLLSLKDMCTIDIIDRLINANIYSFKIEGRLKSPSYAAGVSSIYRKYIDFCLENPGKELVIDKKDRDLLNNLYSRSGSGTGYLDRVNSPKMITLNGGAYSKVSDEEEQAIFDKYIANPSKKNIDIEFNAYPASKAQIIVKCNLNGVEVVINKESKNDLEFPKNAPATTEDILKNLKKLGNTSYSLKNYSINTAECFVPASLINQLRREAVEELDEIVFNSLCKRAEDCHNTYKEDGNEVKIEDSITAFVDTKDQFDITIKSDLFTSIVVSDTLAFDLSDSIFNKKIYVELPPVFRMQNKAYFEKITKLVDSSCFSGVYVSQNDAYYYLKSIGFKKEICADTNIYSYNSYALKANKKIYDSILAPIELSARDIEEYKDKSISLFMYGKAPLMHSANCIMKTKNMCAKTGKCEKNSYIEIEDRINAKFPIRLRCSDELCFNTIYNSKANSLHKYYKNFKNKGFNNYYFRFTNENSEDMNEIIAYFTELMSGNSVNPAFDYTNGHLKSGIL